MGGMCELVAQHQLFFSNNAFPVKAMPDYETCIDLLEDLLLSPLRLLKWPSGGDVGGGHTQSASNVMFTLSI